MLLWPINSQQNGGIITLIMEGLNCRGEILLPYARREQMPPNLQWLVLKKDCTAVHKLAVNRFYSVKTL